MIVFPSSKEVATLGHGATHWLNPDRRPEAVLPAPVSKTGRLLRRFFKCLPRPVQIPGLFATLPGLSVGPFYDTAWVYHNTTQSIGDLTWTKVAFNSEVFDNAALHSTSTNTSRMTLARAGKYIFGFLVIFAANTTGVRCARLRLNNTTTLFVLCFDPIAYAGTTDTPIASPAYLYTFSASDYVEVEVLQTSGGGALNLQSSPLFFTIGPFES